VGQYKPELWFICDCSIALCALGTDSLILGMVPCVEDGTSNSRSVIVFRSVAGVQHVFIISRKTREPQRGQ
jgi:hypothetical protein